MKWEIPAVGRRTGVGESSRDVMASILINSNPASLGAQRRLGESSASLVRSLERLSSGLRISRASDDPAALAIAAGLDVDARVLNQGVRNLNDGLGFLSVAESVTGELGNTL